MSRFVLSVIVMSVFVLGVLYFVGSKNASSGTGGNGIIAGTSVGSYELSSEKMDLGEMTVEDEKSANFIFKNTSSESMNLGSFETSCNCTMASVKIGGEVSPMFNMRAHMSASEASWEGELAPNETATISVMYKPALMPVYGPIERYVTFNINNSKEVKLTVAANVK